MLKKAVSTLLTLLLLLSLAISAFAFVEEIVPSDPSVSIEVPANSGTSRAMTQRSNDIMTFDIDWIRQNDSGVQSITTTLMQWSSLGTIYDKMWVSGLMNGIHNGSGTSYGCSYFFFTGTNIFYQKGYYTQSAYYAGFNLLVPIYEYTKIESYNFV